MSVTMVIKEPNNLSLTYPKLSVSEYERLTVNKKVIALFPALLIPVRTNTFKNFSADFFLPTTVNHALRIKGAVSKIFALLGAFILDILTLPIRLFTCIPRHFYNGSHPWHPLYKQIQENEELQKTENFRFKNAFKKADYVRVEAAWEVPTPKGIEEIVERFDVRFIQLPHYV